MNSFALLFYVLSFSSLDKQSVYDSIVQSGIKHPDIVFAQAVLESNSFSSKLARRYNNLFGMKKPSKRGTTAIGKTRRDYAIYSDWTESVKDYKLYQDFVFRRREMSRSEYLSWIRRTYSETPTYIQRLNRVLIEHNEIVKK